MDALEQQPRRSVLLVGEHGVGKTALLRAALERLPPQLVPFEATAAEINAGAMYVGELEGRIRGARGATRGPSGRLPGFSEALYAGQHSRSPTGMLDAMLPHIERREMTVVGEIDPPSYEKPRRAAARRRGLRGRPGPAARRAEHRGRRRAAARLAGVAGDPPRGVRAGAAVPPRARSARQPPAPGPGDRGGRGGGGRHEFETSDVLATLASSSGLPLAMLDPSAPLELADVRAFFEGRVLAQPEAVDAIVERIAMIKAGLNDLTRPLGVYLFIGPTGTGKTEIAKALAEFLFGSQRRLVRLDMSEYQTPDSLERLLQTRASSLTDRPACIGAQGSVRGHPARRVREGGGADLGSLPPGLRRPPTDRSTGPDGGLPAQHHHPHLERRLSARSPARPGLQGRARTAAPS